MIVVGFTGSRNGMTAAQRETVARLLDEQGGIALAVHGDCVGADEQFDQLCASRKIHRRARPGTLDQWRAFCKAEQIESPRPNGQRNGLIVSDCDVLIACPDSLVEVGRGSGTWMTVRMARGLRPVRVVWPNGTVDEQ